MARDLLDRVLAQPPAAFALVHRPGATDPRTLDVLVGEVTVPETLGEIELTDTETSQVPGPSHDVLAVIPYRQLAERNFACVDDGAPLLAMRVTEQAHVPLAEALRRLPDTATTLSGGRFDVSDDEYADLVQRVVADEIGTGEGANFVIKRSYRADIHEFTLDKALACFRRLLQQETGAYWTFLVHIGGKTFIGATPERHISVHDGVAVMNPISGTYRYPASGPALDDLLGFLADQKETDELYMVLDEELKMMARVCTAGGHVVGPFLKEMARVAHTEYFIEGRTDRDPREILRETMFAPTVTGSPVESACRVIRRYEPQGRGYYSGAIALIGRDAAGARTLDSAILIRTAEIDQAGQVRLSVGATLVRHSNPAAEVAETRAKAASLIAALGPAQPARFGQHPAVRDALRRRNDQISRFWLTEDGSRARLEPDLAGRRVLVVDAEDTFTAMIAQQLRCLGMSVTVRRFDEAYDIAGHDLVVMGPGPGDPRAVDDPKIARLRVAVEELLAQRRPFLAICLSHQVLSLRLGLALARREVPNQGAQREIDLFGSREVVGFYNTFVARSGSDEVDVDGVGTVEVSRDASTGEVRALRGPSFASIQFHPESVLTLDGVGIVGELIRHALCAEPQPVG
jgi:2-amino-4-deoxychorismate synthase